jgi:hypothetical protein
MPVTRIEYAKYTAPAVGLLSSTTATYYLGPKTV